jgi:hypothetical protein
LKTDLFSRIDFAIEMEVTFGSRSAAMLANQQMARTLIKGTAFSGEF